VPEGNRMRTRTLLYHDVVADGLWNSSGFASGDAAIYKFTRAAFDAHLDRLARSCPAPDLAGASTSSSWMITFDDGGVSAIDTIAPALEARGWRGHFFMTTGWIGAPGFLDAQALRELVARGHTVGSHSHNHPLAMSSLSRDELRREWKGSVDALAEVLGTPPRVASIPGGAYSRTVAETAGDAGIHILFTSEPRERPWRVGDVTCFGRYILWRGMSPEAAAAFAQGRGMRRLAQRFAWDAKKIVKVTCGPLYREFRRRVLSGQSAPQPSPRNRAASAQMTSSDPSNW
jgi:peptidoglycan/xylan/chitin deacetylase (PgdA/CDA1 family)